MVTELKEVLQKIEQLDNDEQVSIAKMIHEELEWETTLTNTQEKLSRLAKEAIEEYKSGRTKKQDW